MMNVTTCNMTLWILWNKKVDSFMILLSWILPCLVSKFVFVFSSGVLCSLQNRFCLFFVVCFFCLASVKCKQKVDSFMFMLPSYCDHPLSLPSQVLLVCKQWLLQIAYGPTTHPLRKGYLLAEAKMLMNSFRNKIFTQPIWGLNMHLHGPSFSSFCGDFFGGIFGVFHHVSSVLHQVPNTIKWFPMMSKHPQNTILLQPHPN